MVDTAEPAPNAERPAGDYAIVEVLGHRTIVGRIAEVERFGTKFLGVEPIWQEALLAPVLIGGASVYQLTTCTAEVAFARAPKEHYRLPPSIAVTVPNPATAALPHFASDEDDDDFDPFSHGEDR